MCSLFCKIFLSFILITLFSSIITLVISLGSQVGPYGKLQSRMELNQVQTLINSLSATGFAVTKIIENGGQEALIGYLQDIETRHYIRIFLLQEDNSNLAGGKLPQGAADLAIFSRDTRDIQYKILQREIIAALPLFTKEGQSMILVGSTARMMPFEIADDKTGNIWQWLMFFRHRFGAPLIIMVLIAWGGCYLLARSLTAPIRNLRKATQQISNGDFSARAEYSSYRKDEIAELSHDFNVMAEQTESLIQSQKRLVRDVSHELRSPLARQNIALELARQRFSEAEPYLARIEKESKRLSELISQLLILTKLEGKIDDFVNEPVSLDKLLREIVQDADFEAANKGKRVEIQNFDEITVTGSEEMLRQALENVIRNGLHYTVNGSAVEISITKGKNDAEIIVRDHGPGVPQEYLEQIFKPLFRVAESRGRDSGGNGVGLAIAKQAILLHGGSIEARNVEQGGLIIEIHLPFNS
ncbi:ATP-binding protein [Desulfurivibrio sp. C05AmB]|uniref:ATP-binding protein n=1 Tax=Desulfurivibrio sp. C05AmB TaxID=3374371 RepID=UPI00376F16E4